ncbi:MAG: zinc-dependent metalloprotease [Candidatus Pseudobacter hemicellulosilyticus]|uniref:Zinc-dependent metalloprotease n=1 Tax=Candidatus Pseudobacter hemicellulosilyticus TaxID=3121375 RepID=A0AAJ5WQC4_9BACT|nr:MAG: zinc-dependent metalloprotease [Pseudobacter sp.]
MKMNCQLLLISCLLVFCHNLLPLDSTAQGWVMPKAKDPVKPYEQVVTGEARTSKGFISVHALNNRYLLEVPDSILGRDLFAVNRLVRSAQDWRHPLGGLCSYGNDWIGQTLFRFRKDAGDKLVLEVLSTSERADSSAPYLLDALQQNNLAPVHASFPVKAYGKAGGSSVIDITDYLAADNPIFGYMAELKMFAMPGTFAADRSYITGVRAYPLNLEISSTRTYNAGTAVLSGEYNSSVILLPKEPMRPRHFDDRVGYLAAVTTEYKAFDGQGGIRNKAFIWRWRVEPRPEDLDKYYRGELVEPAKPIVFYIDPATPKKWVSYLIAGVNDWQPAFEKAGFKNAVLAKEVDPADSSFDINDARHNVIVYKAAAMANAMGHSLQDPRSGEMIESHIQWYHSVMEVLYKWYFLQAGAVDTAAQHPAFSDELMGQLIRFVSSHEIGHALGLRHNWGSSSTTTVAQLRDKQWVEAHGHTPSIMDYARFNYVAQPEDSVGRAGIFPRIGDYDQWAIEWGYKLLPEGADAATEKKVLNQRIIEKLNQGERYRFGIGDDPSAKYPDNQREDLGDDAMEAGAYGIRNLQRIRPNLVKWVQAPGQSYDKLEDMYKSLVGQYEWYIKHVTANIGGVVFTPRSTEQAGDVYVLFAKEKQRRAVAFLHKELFLSPEWLKDDFIFQMTKVDFSLVQNLQRNAIKQLLDPKVFEKLRSQEMADPARAYTVEALLEDLASGIFAEWFSGAPVSTNRRMVQNAYINELLALLPVMANLPMAAEATVRQQAKQLLAASRKAAAATKDELTRIHLEGIARKLEEGIVVPLKQAENLRGE